MKRIIEKKGIVFEIGNYTPRNNEYERGLRYRLYVDGIPTDNVFSGVKQARAYIEKNWFIYL